MKRSDVILKVGDAVLLRNGVSETVTKILPEYDGDFFPVNLSNTYTYTLNGKFASDETESSADIVKINGVEVEP